MSVARMNRASPRALRAFVFLLAVVASGVVVMLSRLHGWPQPALVVFLSCLYLFADLTPVRSAGWSISAGFLVLMMSALAVRPSTAAVIALSSLLNARDWREMP